jgi:glycosyltransferase involved in cell wall biosynthesis
LHRALVRRPRAVAAPVNLTPLSIMRIAMVSSTDAYWTPLYARHFLADGHEVRVFSMTPEPLRDREVEVIHICGDRPQRVPAAAWFLAQVPRLRRLLRAYAPDVVFATYMSSNGTAAALAWGGPLVVSGHGGDVLHQLGRVPGGKLLHRAMMLLQWSRASAIHVVADELAETLRRYGVAPTDIVCFPLGIDVTPFASMTAAADSDPPHIVCTRRQEPVYDNHVVIDALAMLRDRGRDVRCTMVGGGPLLRERREQVARVGLQDRVEFVGQVPMDNVRSILASAQIYVSASTTDGASSSLLEAMISGAYPIVSQIRGNERWVRDGENGRTFAIGDARALADAIEDALDDPVLRRARVAANRALVEREGNLQVSMQRTVHLLEDAVAKRIGRAQRTRWTTKASIEESDGRRFGTASAGDDGAVRVI